MRVIRKQKKKTPERRWTKFPEEKDLSTEEPPAQEKAREEDGKSTGASGKEGGDPLSIKAHRPSGD